MEQPSVADRDNPPPPPLAGGNRSYVFERWVRPGEKYRAHLKGMAGGEHFLIHKFPRDDMSVERIQTLKALRKKDDINFPQIVEPLAQGDSLYVVMPWIPGTTLREHITESKKRPGSPHALRVTEAMRLFHYFVHALCRLHSKSNMVHGDLKPENLTVATGPNRLLMIDFGSAWLAERARQRRILDGIDAHYAAPELHAADSGKPGRRVPVDFRSDQFSATVVYYEMLTLKRPYHKGMGGKAGHPDFREAYEKTLVPPSKICPDRKRLSKREWKAVDHAVMTGLNLDSSKRFQNCRAWRDAFEAIRVQSVLAEQLSPVSRVATWVADFLDGFGKPKM